MQTTLSHTEIEQLAHKRAAAKMGWIIHALVYVAVNTGLALVAAASGRHWAVFPALGWGLGLLIHGLVVWAAGPGSALQRIRACMPELARHGNKVAALTRSSLWCSGWRAVTSGWTCNWSIPSLPAW